MAERKLQYISEKLAELADNVYENPHEAVRVLTNVFIEFLKPHGSSLVYLANKFKNAGRIATHFVKTEKALKAAEAVGTFSRETKIAAHVEASVVRDAGKFAQAGHAAQRSAEIILPRFNTFEQARNKALEIVGDLGHDSKPHLGKFGVCAGKIVGRKTVDGKAIWRLDFDPIKGPHINVADFREGSKLKIAIPFNGDESLVESLLTHMNR